MQGAGNRRSQWGPWDSAPAQVLSALVLPGHWAGLPDIRTAGRSKVVACAVAARGQPPSPTQAPFLDRAPASPHWGVICRQARQPVFKSPGAHRRSPPSPAPAGVRAGNDASIRLLESCASSYGLRTPKVINCAQHPGNCNASRNSFRV